MQAEFVATGGAREGGVKRSRRLTSEEVPKEWKEGLFSRTTGRSAIVADESGCCPAPPANPLSPTLSKSVVSGRSIRGSSEVPVDKQKSRAIASSPRVKATTASPRERTCALQGKGL